VGGDQLRQIQPGGFDYVLEITGRPHSCWHLAVAWLAPMGVAASRQ